MTTTTGPRTLATVPPIVDLTYLPDGDVTLTDLSPAGVRAALALFHREYRGHCSTVVGFDRAARTWRAAAYHGTELLATAWHRDRLAAVGRAVAYDLADHTLQDMVAALGVRLTCPAHVDADDVARVVNPADWAPEPARRTG